MKKETYQIQGLHCASCKVLVESYVSKVHGVHSVNVNYASGNMYVEYDENVVNIFEIKKIVDSIGDYTLILKENDVDISQKKSLDDLKRIAIFLCIGIIPFLFIMIWMLLEMFLAFPSLKHLLGYIDGISIFYILQFILSTIIITIGGKQFFVSAWKALLMKTSNMDTLVSLSTVASWLFSSVVTFFPFLFTKDTNVFFDAGIFIIFFITLGKWLEARARYRTNEAVKKLVKLQVKEATLLVNGEEKRISAEDIKLGDILVVKPGQKIPTDGLVIKGNSTIDESMITGESIPSERSVKDKVIGSTLNITGVLYIKATKVGQDTLLSQIINLVQEAQSSQPPIQKLVDKISQRFVPIVIILSLIAFVFWFVYTKDIQLAVYIATSVLVIACPCALGLATPTAIIAGAGRAAQSGILIKDVQALENARQIKVVVFDKTGTITEGMPEVVNFKSFSNSINTKLMAYSLEKNSDHPLGKAITKFTKVNAKIFSVEDFENLNGKGIKGIVNGKDIYIVNPSYAKTLVELPDEVLRYINREENDGYTVVAQLEDKIVTGMYSLADVVKADSKKAIEELRGMGIKTIMLTGDNRSTAERIGKEVGVDRVIAQVLPQEKDEAIKNLKEEYKGVIAMVGDGINDAPALARADIGIAMGMGTDIAIEAGDVIIISGSLKKVKDLILISKKTINILHQNLYWAFGYNVIAIPIAMGLLYLPFNLLLSPIIASFTMAMSSVSVVSNSLRLRNVKI